MNQNRTSEAKSSLFLTHKRFSPGLFLFALINLILAINVSAGLRITLRAPTNLSVTSQTASSVTLSWIDQSNTEDYFDLERSALSSRKGFSSVATLPANSTTFTDTTVSPSTTYYYRISVVSAGTRKTSGVITTTTPANDCVYTISQSSISIGVDGGSSAVDVLATAGCGWSATSNDGWITITAGASGSGTGTVSYAVAANAGCSQRSGTLSIAGQTFTVAQAAGSGSFSILPGSRSHGAGAEAGR